MHNSMINTFCIVHCATHFFGRPLARGIAAAGVEWPGSCVRFPDLILLSKFPLGWVLVEGLVFLAAVGATNCVVAHAVS